MILGNGVLRWLDRIENTLIGVLVLAMVLLADAQIVLRNLFDSGIDWADPLLRAMVLWTAMLGALAAARDDKHIGLDLVKPVSSERTVDGAVDPALGKGFASLFQLLDQAVNQTPVFARDRGFQPLGGLFHGLALFGPG